MKILMLLPRFNRDPYIYDVNDGKKNYNYLLPIGLAYISAVLKKEGYEVHCLNPNHSDDLIRNVVKAEMAGQKYDIVFTGGLSLYYPNIRDSIQYIREYSPGTKIVVGGGMISSQPDIMFKLLKPDYIIIGEGEDTSVELVRCIEHGGDLLTIDGLGFRDKTGNLVINTPRKPLERLDNLPFPDYEGFAFEDYLDHILPGNYIVYDIEDNPRFYPLLASRSCPYGCTFCYHPLGKKYRQRSLDNIMEEIQYSVKKYRINILFFYDELFSHDRERVLEFCRKLKEFFATIPWNIHWWCNMRVDGVDDELITVMRASRCHIISLGLESYSPVVLNSMKKFTKPEQIEKALRILSTNGIGAQGSFIFGDSAETMETAAETLAFYRNNMDIIRGGVQLGFIIPFQGSPIYKRCVEKGIIKDEIEFIERRAKEGINYNEPMNLTDTLSDIEFEHLKNQVMVTHLTSRHCTIPVSTKTVDGIPEVHIRCPYCRKISIIKNISPPKGHVTQNIGCRHCNGRFEMVSKTYPLIRFLIKTIGFNRIYALKKMMAGN